MAKKWRDVQKEIKQLYLTQDKPLEEVRTLMKERHSFERSIRAYKTHLEKWQYQKYRCARRFATRLSSQSRSGDQERNGSISTALVPYTPPEISTATLKGMGQELQRQSTLAREQGCSLAITRQSLGTLQQITKTEEIDKAIANIAKAEENIASMRKSLETMLTAKSAQFSSPTGFASCWRKEPMTLEDAHGNLIPIPIELVVSWEVFEDILRSHFRTLPGRKKVSKGEYVVEDSLTRCTFSRSRPWSSFCRPGRTLDMSMIFKNIGNTVVCPKCDTISTEKNGVLVECTTPGCNMLFRTEVEVLTADKRIPSKTAVRASVSLSSQENEDNETEVTPGMFKRVIVRVVNYSPMAPNYPLQPNVDPGDSIRPSYTWPNFDMSIMSDEFLPQQLSPGISSGQLTPYDDSKLKPIYARSLSPSPPRGSLTPEQRELKRQRDWARRESKIRMGKHLPPQSRSTNVLSQAYNRTSEPPNTSYLSNGQLTSMMTTRARHHRESSLSSLRLAGPASPYWNQSYGSYSWKQSDFPVISNEILRESSSSIRTSEDLMADIDSELRPQNPPWTFPSSKQLPVNEQALSNYQVDWEWWDLAQEIELGKYAGLLVPNEPDWVEPAEDGPHKGNYDDPFENLDWLDSAAWSEGPWIDLGGQEPPQGLDPSLDHMKFSRTGAFSPSRSAMNPITSTTSGWIGPQEPIPSAADEAWRRRTWHPDT